MSIDPRTLPSPSKLRRSGTKPVIHWNTQLNQAAALPLLGERAGVRGTVTPDNQDLNQEGILASTIHGL